MDSFPPTMILLSLSALLIAGIWLAGSATVWWRPSLPAKAPPPPARDLTLVAADGMMIAATFWPGRSADSPGIVLLHGVYDSRQRYAGNAGWLAQQGFAVLTVDLRGHGQSGAAPHAFGLTESRDARAAFDWLKAEQRGAPVGVIGISLGGAAALLGDEGPLPAQGLALQAVYSDIDAAIRNRIAAFLPEPAPFLLTPLLKYQARPRFGVGPERLRPIEALAQVQAPVMVIGGGSDRFTPPDESRALFDAAGGPKTLLILDGMDHAEASWADTEAYRAQVRDFFLRALGAP